MRSALWKSRDRFVLNALLVRILTQHHQCSAVLEVPFPEFHAEFAHPGIQQVKHPAVTPPPVGVRWCLAHRTANVTSG